MLKCGSIYEELHSHFILVLTKPPNKLTPLMLKKNSQFVQCIDKMRYYTDISAISKDGLHDPVKMGQQYQIRRMAEQTLSAFKVKIRIVVFFSKNLPQPATHF